MYVPKHFDEPRVELLHELMRARPLATVITRTADGLDAEHIPLHLLPEASPGGTLRGHLARANPLGGAPADGVETLAIFNGPDAYVSPSWYPTKTETGKAVPTWNYVVVHAHGRLRIIDDAAWLRAHLEALTARHEAPFPAPWHLSDAPPEFIDKLVAAIVGVEITITRLAGKWKTSQNQPPQNRAGVADGLSAQGGADSLAMAALVATGTRSEREKNAIEE